MSKVSDDWLDRLWEAIAPAVAWIVFGTLFLLVPLGSLGLMILAYLQSEHSKVVFKKYGFQSL